MVKVTEKGIEFCGEFFKFKRVSAAQVLEHQAKIEEQQELFKEAVEKSDEWSDDIEFIDAQITAKGNFINLTMNNVDSSSDDLKKASEFQLEIMDLNDKRRKLVKKIKKLNKEHENEIKELDKFINETYGELACLQLEGLTKEFYLQNADNTDVALVKLLAHIRRMFALGSSVKEVERFIRNNANVENDNSFQ